MSGHLVGFLGIGPKGSVYTSTQYGYEGRVTQRVRFTALAFAELFGLTRVTLFCTTNSEDLYRTEIEAEAEGRGVQVRFLQFPLGRSADELERQLHALVPVLLDQTARPLYLDITHGFRSFPFFASSLLAFASSISPADNYRVVYGAFAAASEDGVCPVWDLSATLQAYQHGFELSTFLRSGRLSRAWPDRLKELADSLDSTDGQGTRDLRSFAQALQEFADHFATIRMGPMLLGRSAKEVGSAVRLRNALHQHRGSLERHFPMLATVLEQIEHQIAPLTHDYAIEHLGTPQGLSCSLGLARLYFECERYSECAVVLREMAVDLYCEPEGSMPGYANFHTGKRDLGRGTLVKKDRNLNQRLNAIRNDIEHGGYDDAKYLKSPAQLRTGLAGLLREMKSRVDARLKGGLT